MRAGWLNTLPADYRIEIFTKKGLPRAYWLGRDYEFN